MAVTKQTYTANNIWTASQLAGLFRSAFIDAGLMTEWYDSFTSGSIENRVLEVVYDGAKAYGKTYYWFMFTTTGVFYHYATGWNTSTKVPTGTQYLDYFSNTTNATTNMATLRSSLSTSSPVQVIRYASQINSTHDWFLIGQSNSFSTFTISPSSHAPASWIDLDKTLFHHLVSPSMLTSGSAAGLMMTMQGGIRRSALVGSAYVGATTNMIAGNFPVSAYAAFGRTSNSSNSNLGNNSSISNFGFDAFPQGGRPAALTIPLPTANSTANPAYSANYNPVCIGMPYSLWLANSPLPDDFGIIPHYANNTMQQLDTFVVTAGVEEWEILTVVNSSTITTGASLAFAARTV